MRILISFFLILVSLSIHAQKEYTTSVPKAINYFENALRFYDAHQNEKALDAVDGALRADPKFIEAHMMMANILSDMKLYERAILAYKDAIAINENFFPNNYYSLGKVEYLTGIYSDAKTHFEKFLTFPKLKPILKANAEKFVSKIVLSEEFV